MSFRIHTDPVVINLHALVSHNVPVEEKDDKKKIQPSVPTIVEPEESKTSLHHPGPDAEDQVVMRIKRKGAGTGTKATVRP